MSRDVGLLGSDVMELWSGKRDISRTARMRHAVVLCKGRKLNGAVSSPARPGALCSQFALYPQNAGNLVH